MLMFVLCVLTVTILHVFKSCFSNNKNTQLDFWRMFFRNCFWHRNNLCCVPYGVFYNLILSEKCLYFSSGPAFCYFFCNCYECNYEIWIEVHCIVLLVIKDNYFCFYSTFGNALLLVLNTRITDPEKECVCVLLQPWTCKLFVSMET